MTQPSLEWQLFTGKSAPHDDWKLPEPPSWRPFGGGQHDGKDGTTQAEKLSSSRRQWRADTFQIRPEEADMVNAAIYLRRPLLITGKPGTGKSSLAYAVAKELMLGEVLYWPITTRTTLKGGQYRYDAIGRLQDAKQNKGRDELKNIGKYITLGPLGSALLPSPKPRVLLIDEIDKGDIDLPNDLLSVFEEGWFEIPELERIKDEAAKITVRTAYTDDPAARTHDVVEGRIRCDAFPLVILTSNGERDFPPAFLRRCLRLRMKQPTGPELKDIVAAHLDAEFVALEKTAGAEVAQVRRQASEQARETLIAQFLEKQKAGDLSTDQLLNALFMVTRDRVPVGSDKQRLIDALLKPLTSADDMSDGLDGES